MIEKSIAIYSFIDTLLKYLHHQEDKKRKLSDAEVLTTAIISALYFGGHLDKARSFMHSTKLIPNMLDKSRYNRRLHAIGEEITSLFLEIGTLIKQVATCKDFVLDSFPVPVCDNIRISRCKLLQSEAYRGYKASMRRYFYGIKVQLITTDCSIPVEFSIVAGSQADVKGLHQLPFSMPAGSALYADSAYTNYHLEDMLADDRIKLYSQRKSNAHRKDTPSLAYLKERMRKVIETSISGIKGLFLKKIHAVTFQGFLIKILLFLLAFQINKAFLI
ncbi:hypothetical protein Aasi_0261 [Candidatus Amoebophilus asiaticus 5a2]|uniref:Transposase DDE domain-containing protein n=1 Tax=Amoebophilus asiaticus (strain 5a2) TaxID=452471 RepID=B3ER50_AMOA5|nr:IS982-like element ISCaa5 family transposase [Candidatus Amoebophilus asiaticus]ACE05702.1 hypothetical protein Aasi_0261 [Candidatus Amoebophilus asiaticus 5a2]